MTRRRGQSIMEYALVVAFVTMAAMGMQTYGRRGIQGVVKAAADEIGAVGEKAAAEDPMNKNPNKNYRSGGQLIGIGEESRDRDVRVTGKIPAGTVLERQESTRQVTARELQASEQPGAVITRTIADHVQTLPALHDGISSYSRTVVKQK